jgi:hypothetical protein
VKKDRFVASFRKCFGLLLIIVGFSSYCFAQGTNGTISGNVKDASGGIIAAATVTVTNEGTSEQQTVQSDSAGNYSLLALPPAVYDLQVQNQGFNTYSQKGIKVDVTSALQINVVMAVGTTATTVEVAAEAVRVETVNAQIGNVIGGTSMESMPLNGRSYIDLMALQSGVNSVSPAVVSASIGPLASASAATGNVSINGHQEADNGFLVNGGNVEQTRNNGAAIIPNMDAIAEFRVITNNVDAEYGQYAGGIITVVTKSGTNGLHGDLFEYLRNTTLDAKNFYDTQVGQFNRNQFGGTLGGPIKKDKAFFFVDYQGTREIQGIATGVIPVPTLAQRGGNFSAASLSGTVQGSYWAGVLSQRLGYPVTQGEHYSTTGCTTSATCVFPGGIIPNAAFDPAAVGLLASGIITMPNQGLGSFVGSGSLANNWNTDANQGGARFDYNARRWGTLSAYWSISQTELLRPYGNNNVPGSPVNDHLRAQQWNLSDTKIFGATAVNEFRINVTRPYTSVNKPQSFGPTLGTLGFQTPYVFTQGPGGGGITGSTPACDGSPNLKFTQTGFTVGIPDFYYQQSQVSPQVIDNFSKILGSHSTKFGAEWYHSRFRQYFPCEDPNGTFTFDGSETGSDFADFLIGAPVTNVHSSTIDYDNRKTYVGIYAEDSWKARHNLTISYGLRWDYIPNWYEVRNATSDTYVAGEQSTLFPTAPVGLVFAGDPNPLGGTIPRTVARTPKTDFAPRIGIAYAPTPHSRIMTWLLGAGGKTSVRAAYGIFYTNNTGVQIYNEGGSPPFVATWTSSTPPLLFEPYRNRADGVVLQAPPFPSFFPAPPGTTGSYQGCATCPVAPINWEIPINGDPATSVYNTVPYADDYHLTIERQFGTATVLGVGYVGSQGHHLLSSNPSNYGNAALCLSLNAAAVMPGTPVCGPNLEDVVFTLKDGTKINGTDGPLGNNFAQNALYVSNGNSNFNSLQTTLRHTSGRFTLMVGYTYGRAENDGTYNQSPSNIFNRQLSRGLSNFDITHSFVFSYNYLLPFDRMSNRYQRLTGGWHLAGITRFSTGLPIVLSQSGDKSLTGVSWDVPIYNGAPLNLGANNPRSGLPYFNTAAFTREPLGTLNTATKYFFHGPGINNFDMSLLKETKITERTSLEFRAEFFNVFNHAQFINPSGSVTAKTFGVITSARSPRIGQLALKLLF